MSDLPKQPSPNSSIDQEQLENEQSEESRHPSYPNQPPMAPSPINQTQMSYDQSLPSSQSVNPRPMHDHLMGQGQTRMGQSSQNSQISQIHEYQQNLSHFTSIMLHSEDIPLVRNSRNAPPLRRSSMEPTSFLVNQTQLRADQIVPLSEQIQIHQQQPNQDPSINEIQLTIPQSMSSLQSGQSTPSLYNSTQQQPTQINQTQFRNDQQTSHMAESRPMQILRRPSTEQAQAGQSLHPPQPTKGQEQFTQQPSTSRTQTRNLPPVDKEEASRIAGVLLRHYLTQESNLGSLEFRHLLTRIYHQLGQNPTGNLCDQPILVIGYIDPKDLRQRNSNMSLVAMGQLQPIQQHPLSQNYDRSSQDQPPSQLGSQQPEHSQSELNQPQAPQQPLQPRQPSAQQTADKVEPQKTKHFLNSKYYESHSDNTGFTKCGFGDPYPRIHTPRPPPFTPSRVRRQRPLHNIPRPTGPTESQRTNSWILDQHHQQHHQGRQAYNSNTNFFQTSQGSQFNSNSQDASSDYPQGSMPAPQSSADNLAKSMTESTPHQHNQEATLNPLIPERGEVQNFHALPHSQHSVHDADPQEGSSQTRHPPIYRPSPHPPGIRCLWGNLPGPAPLLRSTTFDSIPAAFHAIPNSNHPREQQSSQTSTDAQPYARDVHSPLHQEQSLYMPINDPGVSYTSNNPRSQDSHPPGYNCVWGRLLGPPQAMTPSNFHYPYINPVQQHLRQFLQNPQRLENQRASSENSNESSAEDNETGDNESDEDDEEMPSRSAESAPKLQQHQHPTAEMTRTQESHYFDRENFPQSSTSGTQRPVVEETGYQDDSGSESRLVIDSDGGGESSKDETDDENIGIKYEDEEDVSKDGSDWYNMS